MRTLASLVWVGAWPGCTSSVPAGDADADGLDDRVEVGLGSDPADPDSDDDGLLDGEEVDLGTLWLDPDSDDDGYSDRDEVHENTDPLDGDDLIYEGGWPYYFEKTELKGGVVFEVGKRFAPLTLLDQHRDTVSLWDFYNDDRYVIVDLCAGWVGRICDDLSRWVAGEHGAAFDPWITVAEAVDAGDLYWITILAQDESFEPADADDVIEWASLHPNDRVPTLADPDAESFAFTELTALPYLVLLAPDLTVHTVSSPYYTAVLDAAVDVLTPNVQVE